MPSYYHTPYLACLLCFLVWLEQAERCHGFRACTRIAALNTDGSIIIAPPSRTSKSKKPALCATTDSSSNSNSNNDNAHSNNSNEESKSFTNMGLSMDLQAAIPWTKPTPIQGMAIPKILIPHQQQQQQDASIWIQAPTGSGKTLVYAVSLFQKLFYQPRPAIRTTQQQQQQQHGTMIMIRSLILAPTRELAIQIGKALSKLASRQVKNGRSLQQQQQPRIVVIHGGVPVGPQLDELDNNSRNKMIDIVVATPGRLVDLLTQPANERADTDLQYKVLKALEQQQKQQKQQSKKGRRGGSSLSLAQLQELELDKPLEQNQQLDLRNMLQGLEYLVLDEADRLLSRSFEQEMDALLDLIQSSKEHDTSGRSLSTWLFSATFPKAIEPRVDQVFRRLGSTSSEPPIHLSCINADRLDVDSNQEQVSSTLQKRLGRAKSSAAATTLGGTSIEQIGPASTIQLRTIRLEKPSRTLALRRLLDDHPDWDRVLVFVSTRYSSEHVARKLRRVGILAAELHGKLDQEARSRRYQSFVSGKIRVLLCTDLAARGLDIDCLPAVVNYDLPRSTTDFVHRTGRTGRAGRPGVAVTFVTPESESHLELIESRHLPKSIDREVLPGLEPNEEEWAIKAQASRLSVPGVEHSSRGLAHDRMFGGIKGKRKSKKDRLREKAAREAALQKRTDE